MGTNIFLGEISYITQALTAVLQLGVTMDYSIFLSGKLSRQTKYVLTMTKNVRWHMRSAIHSNPLSASSITTVAGFAALCFMTFALGRDLGIVMAKGVIIGVIVCITLLPSLILFFDKWIDKTTHRAIFPNFHKSSAFITRHRVIPLLIFAILFVPAFYGNNHVKVYYNLDQGLPQDLDSAIANKKLEEKFNMNNMHILLLKNGLSSKEKNDMKNEIEKVDGVKWVLGMNSIVGANVPDDMIPNKYKDMLKSDNWELQFICSDYKTATDQVNAQIASINDIVKKYSKDSMVIGEAPLTKDLQDVTDVDLATVNYHVNRSDLPDHIIDI